MIEHIGVTVYCVVCRRPKAPRGRSVAAAMANSMCDSDCGGYYQEPFPGQLWPGETQEEFGYPKPKVDRYADAKPTPERGIELAPQYPKPIS